MEDLPNSFGAGMSAFRFEPSTDPVEIPFGSDILGLVFDTIATKMDQSLFVVSATGQILMAAGRRFGTVQAYTSGRFAALWPRESRSLAEGALDAALSKASEVSFVVACVPGEVGPQTWQATLTPLQTPPKDDSPVPDVRGLVLVALEEVTAATRVAGLKRRAR